MRSMWQLYNSFILVSTANLYLNTVVKEVKKKYQMYI